MGPVLVDGGNQIRNMAISQRGNVLNALNATHDGLVDVADVIHEMVDDISEGKNRR